MSHLTTVLDQLFRAVGLFPRQILRTNLAAQRYFNKFSEERFFP